MYTANSPLKGLVDFHCHLDLFPNHKALIDECESLGIKTLTVTNAPSVWRRNFELTKNCKNVRVALGLHPQLAHQRSKELDLFEELFPRTRYIGEVGLDGSPEFTSTMAIQRQVFERILDLCSGSGGKILTVHSRRADREVINTIQDHLSSDRGKIVLHWFTGSKRELMRALDLGMYFSINYRMTQTEKGQELIKCLPLDRILTESDGPFIKFSVSPTTPKDVIHTVQAAAMLKKCSEEKMANQITDNLGKLIKEADSTLKIE